MRLDEPLLRLPLAFDPAALAAEVEALPPEAWVAHPNQLPGNAAVRLVTTNGAMTDDTAAPMAPTPYLRACPHVAGVMAAIGAVWGRSRLMRLAPGATVPPHIDTHYYWRTHVRLHVPIVTNPAVRFTCGGDAVNMAAGECWVFDTFSSHNVVNGGTASRVHLVLDTVGGEGLLTLIEAARAGTPTRTAGAARATVAALAFERTDTSGIMSPWELKHHLRFIAEQAVPDPRLAAALQRLDRFAAGWTGAWAQYGAAADGIPAYRRLIQGLETDLLKLGGEQLRLRNNLPLYRQLAELVFTLSAPLKPAAAPLRASG